MRLYGDHRDVTLILQLESHSLPTHRRPRSPGESRNPPISQPSPRFENL